MLTREGGEYNQLRERCVDKSTVRFKGFQKTELLSIPQCGIESGPSRSVEGNSAREMARHLVKMNASHIGEELAIGRKVREHPSPHE
jgi:hypothetical protein